LRVASFEEYFVSREVQVPKKVKKKLFATGMRKRDANGAFQLAVLVWRILKSI